MNKKHISALLRKDVLTLKRNWIFLLSFIVLPLVMMLSFSYLQDLVQGEMAPEQHNFIRK